MEIKSSVKKRMHKLLQETIEHYNSNNRSSTNNGLCVYIPDGGVKSEGCAIGRKLPKKYKSLIIKEELNTWDVKTLFSSLGRPKIFENIPIQFLTEIQLLHDTPEYWNEKGLSKKGVDYASALASDYSLKPLLHNK